MNELTKEYIAEKVTSILKETFLKKEPIGKLKEKKITLSLAKKIMDSIEEKAKEMNLNAAIAIVDAAGSYVAVHVMENSLPISFDVAMKKAYTSVALKMTTEQLGELVQPGKQLYGLQSIDSRIIAFGGGSPLKDNTQVLGGIGVSGGTVEQDLKLLEYGVQMFSKLIIGF